KVGIRVRNVTGVQTCALPISLIMPLVIYHGKFLWSKRKLLRDWFINYDELSEEMTKYVPDFEFTLYDFSYANKLDVKGEPKLKADRKSGEKGKKSRRKQNRNG